MPDCIPFFEPGQDPTCRANGAVTGCRFVQVKTGVNAVDGLAQVETCGAGLEPLGVAARDVVDAETVMVYRWGILPVLAGAALSHGQKVQSDAQGRAIPLAGGVCCGTVMLDAADATLAKIAVRIGTSPPATAVVGDQAAIADIAVADAADLATAIALANATKAKVNTLLAELRLAGVIAP